MLVLRQRIDHAFEHCKRDHINRNCTEYRRGVGQSRVNRARHALPDEGWSHATEEDTDPVIPIGMYERGEGRAVFALRKVSATGL
jgi:hypothetical protein